MARGKFQPAVIHPVGQIFAIGLIEYQQHFGREASVQAGNFLARQKGARRVVGIGDEHYPGALCHSSQQGIDIGGVIAVIHFEWRRTAPTSRDIVDGETEAAEHHLVTHPGEGLRREVKQLVRSCSANNAFRRDSVNLADSFAQPVRARIGVGGGGLRGGQHVHCSG